MSKRNSLKASAKVPSKSRKSSSKGKESNPLMAEPTTILRPALVLRRAPVSLARVIGQTITVKPGVERANQMKALRLKAA